MTSRTYLGTLHNAGEWTKEQFENHREVFIFNANTMHTLSGQLEKCPKTGKLHWQFFVKLKNPVRIPGAKKELGLDGVHLEKHSWGKEENMEAYCKKSRTAIAETYFKYGENVSQGSRTDLEDLKKKIEDGAKVDDLLMEDTKSVARNYKTLSKIEDIVMRKKYRTEMTKGLWYYGYTGVGKSHKAFEGYTPETHYVLNLNDKGWWEGYTQQETVIINDFRGELKLNDLLLLVDKWPHSVPRRGREPMPFLSKTVIVTSALAPCDVYKNALSSEDRADQLERRFEVIQMSQCHDVSKE